MPKRSLLDLPIYTYSPNQEGLPCLAYIGRPGQFPMQFTGKTPFQAHQNAEAWRQEKAKSGQIKAPAQAEDA